MQISIRGINLIKRFEGFRSTPYLCAAGVLTIGYGHTRKVKEGMKISEQEASMLLAEDIEGAERQVNSYGLKLNQNQYDALVSFVFNVGSGNFAKSTMLRFLKAEDYKKASKEFLRWTKAGGKEQRGLVLRREAEKSLFDA